MDANPAGFRPARGIASIGVSGILRTGAAAAKRKREGRPVIVLGAGEPAIPRCTPDPRALPVGRDMPEGAVP